MTKIIKLYLFKTEKLVNNKDNLFLIITVYVRKFADGLLINKLKCM